MAIEHTCAFELGTVAQNVARFDDSLGSASFALGTSGGRTNQYIELGAGYLIKYRRDRAGNLAPSDGVIVGIARQLAGGWGTQSGCEVIRLYDSAGSIQITLREMADGTIRLYRGDSSTGTLLATSGAITEGFWMYYELKVVIHPTNGSYEFRINEVTQFSASGVNTQETAVRNVGRVGINGRATNGGSPVSSRFDDLYIANLSQPIPANGFYGNIKVEHLPPNTAGSATQFSPFPANSSNYLNVDEYTHDSDNSYNYAGTVNYSDLYSMQNMSALTGSVRAMQVTHESRKDDALSRVVAPLVRSGSVTTVGQNDSLTTSYDDYEEIWNFNPTTSDYFSISEINSIEVGLRITG